LGVLVFLSDSTGSKKAKGTKGFRPFKFPGSHFNQREKDLQQRKGYNNKFLFSFLSSESEVCD
jgi:hypothetical protein